MTYYKGFVKLINQISTCTFMQFYMTVFVIVVFAVLQHIHTTLLDTL